MLTLTFLGVGSAFAKRSFQSNVLIEVWSRDPADQGTPDDNLLVDFGATGPIALHHLKNQADFAYLDQGGVIFYPAIRRIFITHLHSDHVGGLEELAGTNMHRFRDLESGQGFRPELIASSEVLTALWECSLRGGLSAVTGRQVGLEDYFVTVPLDPTQPSGTDRFMLTDRYQFRMIRTDHIRIKHKYDWPSFGLVITDLKTKDTAVFSGDACFDPEGIACHMANAKVCFHEVQLDDPPSPVHTTLTDLQTLPEDVRSKTFLYHYGDNWDSGSFDFVKTEFAGFANAGRRYVLFE